MSAVTAVNFFVSGMVAPIAQLQKEMRQEILENQKEMRQEITQVREAMVENQKEMHQEMRNIEREILRAIGKIDDKYALHGERIAKLEK